MAMLEICFRKRDLIQYHQVRSWQVTEGTLAIEAPYKDSFKCIGFLSKGDFISKSIASMEFELLCLDNVRLKSASFDSVPILQVSDTLDFATCITGTRVEERLFNLLTYLARKIGKVTSEGIEITKAPHDLYASCIGATRVTVTRSFQLLESQGRIRKGKVLTLLDKGNLLAA
ncbi:MAG: helix-turn-helix domain-containing protein [Calothrix sp. FI2-JRJ7]|jgi:hypothetical protein|nr:helix-turn-helix domain-containing protein [Calothrix sp. FI2-JRJ7]